MSEKPKRRCGRRPLFPGHQSQVVHVRLPDPLYDALCAIAREHDIPLRAVVREAIARGLNRTDASSLSAVSFF